MSTAAPNPAEDLANEQFPTSCRQLVPAALRRSYAAADHAREVIPWLRSPSGDYLRGDLIRIAAEAEFERLVRTGRLPFDGRWEPYKRPTGKHFVMFSEKLRITINQVPLAGTMPRHAEFRFDFGMPNTAFLFDEWNTELARNSDRKHLLLLHGYQQLEFANLAMPNVLSKKIAWQSVNLLTIPHEIEGAQTTPAEGPTDSPDPEALDDLIRAIHDSKIGNE